MDDPKLSRTHGSPGTDPRTSGRDAPASSQQQQPHAPLDLRTAHLWHLQPVRDLLVIAVVVLAIYAGYAIRTVTVPLLVALALAYLVEPIVVRMSRWRRMNRPLAVGAILAALGATITVGAAIVIPLAVGQTLSFAENLRNHRYDGTIERAIEIIPEQYRDDAQSWLDRFVFAPREGDEAARANAEAAAAQSPSPEGEAGAETTASAKSGAEAGGASIVDPARALDLGSPILSIIGAGSRGVYTFALAVLQIGLVAFLIPFYFYYFSVNWPSITEFFARLVPDERKDTVFTLVSEMDRAVAGFVRGRIVICIVMGVMFAIGWQACGVPYGLALGLLTGAFSIVPYLGGIGLPFAIGLLAADQFAQPEAERMAIWMILAWPTIVFVVVQTIEGYVLTPVIAGKATNLDPVTIVVAILAGGSVAGVYGMLLAIPIAACGKIAIKRVVLPRVIEFARGRAADPLPLERAHDEQ